MNEIEKLVQLFSKFPGVGKRQARRFVYHLLLKEKSYTQAITRELENLHAHIEQCTHCMRFFERKNQETTLCKTCSDSTTDKTSMLVVEKDVDLESVEKSKVYTGRYFVIGGTVPILEKHPEECIRLKEFTQELERAIKEDGLKEIILAFSATPEGEHTAEYLKRVISPLSDKAGLTLSVLGRGLSTGSELEYSDDDTLKNALRNRGAF